VDAGGRLVGSSARVAGERDAGGLAVTGSCFKRTSDRRRSYRWR